MLGGLVLHVCSLESNIHWRVAGGSTAPCAPLIVNSETRNFLLVMVMRIVMILNILVMTVISSILVRNIYMCRC